MFKIDEQDRMERRIVQKHGDLEVIMDSWANYYSGINDVAPTEVDGYWEGVPCCNQGFGTQRFYRIIEIQEGSNV